MRPKESSFTLFTSDEADTVFPFHFHLGASIVYRNTLKQSAQISDLELIICFLAEFTRSKSPQLTCRLSEIKDWRAGGTGSVRQ